MKAKLIKDGSITSHLRAYVELGDFDLAQLTDGWPILVDFGDHNSGVPKWSLHVCIGRKLDMKRFRPYLPDEVEQGSESNGASHLVKRLDRLQKAILAKFDQDLQRSIKEIKDTVGVLNVEKKELFQRR